MDHLSSSCESSQYQENGVTKRTRWLWSAKYLVIRKLQVIKSLCKVCHSKGMFSVSEQHLVDHLNTIRRSRIGG